MKEMDKQVEWKEKDYSSGWLPCTPSIIPLILVEFTLFAPFFLSFINDFYNSFFIDSVFSLAIE